MGRSNGRTPPERRNLDDTSFVTVHMRLLAHELCKDIDLTFQGSFQVNWSWNLTNYHDEHFCSLGEFDTSVKWNRTT